MVKGCPLSSVWVGSLKNAKLIPFHDNHDHVNSGDGLDHSAHEMVQLRLLRGQSKATRKTTALDIRRGGCGLFTDLLGEIQWDTAPERREVQESWLLYKDPLL